VAIPPPTGRPLLRFLLPALLLFPAFAGAAKKTPAVTFGAWFPEFWNDFVVFQRNYTRVDSISMAQYGAKADGSVSSHRPEYRGMIRWAQERGIKVYLTIGGGPPTHPAAMEGAAGDQCVADLVKICEKFGYDGVDIDFEEMSGKARPIYTAWAEKLAAAMRKMSPPRLIRLTVQDSADPESEQGKAFDYAALGKIADYLCVMCYDYAWSEPGSLMPRDYYIKTLAYTRGLVPADKFIPALPWYGRDWNPADKTHEDITWDEWNITTGIVGHLELMELYHPATRWDEEGGELTYSYTNEGKYHEVWLPDSRTFSWMVDEALKAGVAGIYVWHMAHPDPASWAVLDKKLGKRPPPKPGRDLIYPETKGRILSFSFSSAGGTLSLTGARFDASRANQVVWKARVPAWTYSRFEVEQVDGAVFAGEWVNGTGELSEYTLALAALQPVAATGTPWLDQSAIKGVRLNIRPGQEAGEASLGDVKFTLVWDKPRKPARKVPSNR